MRLADRIERRDRRRKSNRRARELVGSDARELPPPGSALDFVPKVNPRFQRPEHLADLADAFERGAAKPGAVRELFSYPVRHGKTTFAAHYGIPYLLRSDPTRSILYASYAFGFAKKQTGKAKAVARKAGVRLARGRRGDEWWTRDGGFVKAVGIGGQITGEGFTDVIIDDPHKNRAEAESRVIREGVIEAFFNDIYTRQDPRGTNFYILHARWHVNDLIGVLRALPGAQAWVYTNRPALDSNGEALAPWLFTAEQLEEIRETVGPYVFASLYQGSPRRRGGNLFGSSPTLAILSEPARARIAIGVDLARTSSTRADYNAAVVMRRDLDAGNVDVLDAVRERGAITDRVDGDSLADAGFVRELVRLLHEYPGAELTMYAMDNELPFVALLEKDLRELLGYAVKIHALPISGDKYLRAQAYAAAWNKGRVRIYGRPSVKAGHEETTALARQHWQGPFVVEHIEFTGAKGGEDDQVDAGAAAYDHLCEEKKTGLAEAMAAARRGG